MSAKASTHWAGTLGARAAAAEASRKQAAEDRIAAHALLKAEAEHQSLGFIDGAAVATFDAIAAFTKAAPAIRLEARRHDYTVVVEDRVDHSNVWTLIARQDGVELKTRRCGTGGVRPFEWMLEGDDLRVRVGVEALRPEEFVARELSTWLATFAV